MNFKALLTAAALLLPATISQADKFPSGPVEIVIAAGAGAGQDIMVRAIAAELEKKWAEPTVVLNKTGGNQTIADGYVAKAKPDGHTILNFGPNRSLLAAKNDPNAGYDVVNGLVPVTQVNKQPMVIVTRNSLGVSNLAEFVELAKSAEDPMIYGDNGPGGILDLSARRLMVDGGFELTEVSYQSANDVLRALMGDEVDVAIVTLGVATSYIKNNMITALAVASAERNAAFPDIPTARESIDTDFAVEHWFGFFVPKGTPDEIINQLHSDIVEVLGTESVKNLLLNGGFEIVGNSPAEFAKVVADEVENWKALMD